jgi:hypothetical protein
VWIDLGHQVWRSLRRRKTNIIATTQITQTAFVSFSYSQNSNELLGNKKLLVPSSMATFDELAVDFVSDKHFDHHAAG